MRLWLGILVAACACSDGDGGEEDDESDPEPSCAATSLARDYCRSAGYGSGLRCDLDASWPPECMSLDTDPTGADVCCP